MKKLSKYLFLGALLILLFSLKSQAQTPNAEPVFYITTAYLLGAFFALVYKSSVGVGKFVARNMFSWWAFLIPLVTTIVLAVPTIIYIIPSFGPPSGYFVSDFLKAFTVVYTVHDVTGDGYKLIIYVNEWVARKEKQKQKQKNKQEQEKEKSKKGKTKNSG